VCGERGRDRLVVEWVGVDAHACEECMVRLGGGINFSALGADNSAPLSPLVLSTLHRHAHLTI